MSESPSASDPEDDGPAPIVLDTTVLSNYARTGSIDWLVDAIRIPVTVRAVRQELEQGVEEGHEYLGEALDAMESVDEAPTTETDCVAVVPLGGLPRDGAPEAMEELDWGEAHALYCAWPEGFLATDDLDARELARRRSVNVTGSIGLLVEGIERGLLSPETADGWLDDWREAGYHSPVESVEELFDDGPPDGE